MELIKWNRKMFNTIKKNTVKYITILAIILAFHLEMSGQPTAADTLFISRDTFGGSYHAVFIENNASSIYYDWITDFSFDNSDSLSYKESLKSLQGEKPVKLNKTKIPKSLPRQWCTLNSYKNKYYLYAPSDWGNNSNLLINDTTIIEYFMEGPYAYVIDSFKIINRNTFEFSIQCSYRTTRKMTIYMIDWEKQIAVFDNHSEYDDYRYTMMVGKARARKFPIIVNYCKYEKQMEFDFGKADLKSILPKLK
jgi:hypothetical protein